MYEAISSALEGLAAASVNQPSPHDPALSAASPAAKIKSLYSFVTATQRALFRRIIEVDHAELWRADGCRDMAQWLSTELGISYWAASRWVNAAYALEHLPATARAFSRGELSVEKVVELTRFATPETEDELIKWARRVNPATIKRKADVANRPSIEDHQDAFNSRYLHYWRDGLMLRFEGALPAEGGARFVKAVERIAAKMARAPEGSENEIDCTIDARRADALVALTATRIADDQDPDRATVIVHAELGALAGDGSGCELEDGPVVHPELVKRLSCDGRLQAVIHGGERKPIGIGRTSRDIPTWLRRELVYRDKGCTFPGCGTRAFVDGHHVVHWEDGGPSDLDNLTLLCRFHHRLVHEFMWQVTLDGSDRPAWFRPDGRRYQPGSTPGKTTERGPPQPSLV